MRVQDALGYSLRLRPTGETSALVDLLSAEHGRVSLLAKGVYRDPTRLAQLQPFTLSAYSWSMPQGLAYLSGLHPVQPTLGLHGARLASGFYLSELVFRLTPVLESQPRVFAAYHQALSALLQTQSVADILRPFEFTLLAELGYLPDLEVDSRQQALHPGAYYRFVVQQGWLPCEPSRADACSTEAIQHLLNEDWSVVRREARLLARCLLQPLLGRPLASAGLFYRYSLPERG